MRRTDVFNRARSPPPGPHDLHRGRPRGSLHGPDIGHQRSLRPPLSVQISSDSHAEPQLNGSQSTPSPKIEPSQVTLRTADTTGRHRWVDSSSHCDSPFLPGIWPLRPDYPVTLP